MNKNGNIHKSEALSIFLNKLTITLLYQGNIYKYELNQIVTENYSLKSGYRIKFLD